MRREFSDAAERLMRADESLVFVTGDLGYNALENLRALGPRFLNAGVTEQSMVSMAAGLASQGLKVIVYSIAPFLVYRTLEQIRIDVCFHCLPVFLVGNGGGYGYGIMGATHHCLEDLACLSPLPDMTCYVPAYNEDVAASLDEMVRAGRPAYLRLGLAQPRGRTAPLPGLEEVQRAAEPRLTVVALGPMLHQARAALDASGLDPHVDLLAAHRLPLTNLRECLRPSLERTGRLLVVEEHVRRGGLAELLALEIAEWGLPVRQLQRTALHYPNGRYGHQAYHQEVCGLDAASLAQLLEAECR